MHSSLPDESGYVKAYGVPALIIQLIEFQRVGSGLKEELIAAIHAAISS
jgi:hypothetical protein